MNEEQARLLKETHQMAKRTHDYLWHPDMPKKKPRAEQLDDLLVAVRAGKFSARAVLWVAGAIAALGAAIAVMKGWVPK